MTATPDATSAGGRIDDDTTRTAPASMLSVITRLGVGGSDQRLHDVLDALPATDHHVVVGSESSDDAIGRLREHQRVTVCPPLVRSLDPRRDVAATRWLGRELRRGGYDALMTHQSKGGLVGRVAATYARTPRVYHSASMASFGPGYGRGQSLLFQLAERLTGGMVDRYFVVGQDLIDRMAANGIAPSKLELVRSSIPAAPFLEARARGIDAAREVLGVEPGSTVVCFVGRLDERKGAPRLADLLAAIELGLGRPLVALIAGRGPCADELERGVRARGLDARVRLLGHTDLVPEVLVASDLVLLPSSAEGVPQVLVQAAISGTPFASFDVDGAHELLVLGASGTVAPVGHDDLLVAHAVSMLRAGPADGPTWGSDVLDQWDAAHIRARYRAAFGA
jgi:glycosyltransferase involved in cell wall biosynthesis